MPLTFRIPPPAKWTKRGTCIVKCVYSLTLDGKRYPERQWPATYDGRKKIEVPGKYWIAYKGVKTKKRQKHFRLDESYEFAGVINHSLDQIERNAKIVEHRIIQEGKTCTPETFKKYWDIEFSEHPVLFAFELFIKHRSKKIKQASIQNYNAVLNKLKDLGNPKFSDFSRDFPEKFANETGLKPGTIRGYLAMISAFLNFANEEGYTNTQEYKRWESPEASKREFSLKDWQIRKIRDVELTSPSEIWARDYFMFLFYTAMRLREPMEITEESGESDFVRMFRYKVLKQKKETWVSFEMPAKALELWDKYNGKIFYKENGKNKPYSVSTLRRGIWAAAEKCGFPPDIVKQIIPHAARHSFTTIAREMGFKVKDIQDHTLQGEKIISGTYDHSKNTSSILKEFGEKFG